MWKRNLLVAIVASLSTTYGAYAHSYADRLSTSMNEAVNGRYGCGIVSTEDYSEACSEIVTGYNYDELRKPYDEATSVVGGICIYELTRTHPGQSQITSVGALMLLLSVLSQKSVNQTRTQLYNLINLNNSDEVRYLCPKIADEATDDSGEFVSLIKTILYTDAKNDFSKNFKSCFSEMVNGETEVLNKSNPTEAANRINSWFHSQCSRFGDIASSEDIRDDTGLIFGTSHYVEINFEDFAFTKREDIDFKISKDNSVTTSVWVGEGQAKLSYNHKLGADMIQIALKGGYTLVIIKPKIGRITELLFKLRDGSIFADLIKISETEYIKLYTPMSENIVGSENYVEGLQLANQLTPIYDRDFDGFRGILEHGSGHVTHMFHKMHLKINGLGKAAKSYSSKTSKSARKVVMDSAFVYYIITPTGTPVIIGTHLHPESSDNAK